jgi:hypothetical protein
MKGRKSNEEEKEKQQGKQIIILSYLTAACTKLIH